MKIYKLISGITLAAIMMVATSCQDYLDVNTDPNNPTDVSEPLLLTGILANFSYQVMGGDPVRITNTWIKQTTYNAVLPHYDNYQLTENDVNNLWTFFSYPQIMQNCKVLSEKADASNALNYSAIARIIWAWNLSIVTDLYGNVPYSQAWQADEFPQPKYDSQEEVYEGAQALLDQAILDIDATEKNLAITPGADDFVFGGNMAKWRKVAFSLKARFHMRLTYAPGFSAATQAQLALDALDEAIDVVADDASFPYVNTPGQENPWFQFAIDGKWNLSTQVSNHYITMLTNLNDPRIHAHAKPVGGVYAGHENGNAPVANLSAIGGFYSNADARLQFLSAVEAKFLEAEAHFILNDRADAETALSEALTLSFAKQRTAIVAGAAVMGIPTATVDANIATYIATYSALPVSNSAAYEQLMTQKYIANFLQFEAYNDWRRTGYPQIDPVAAPFDNTLTTIPLRFPYPSAELQYNSTNVNAEGIEVGFRALGTPVWWNSCETCCTICGDI